MGISRETMSFARTVRIQMKTRCERYSRIVGYYRPVEQWNEGKQAEYADRKTYCLQKIAKTLEAQ